MQEIEVVVAHQDRATVRVGDVFLKIDADQERIDAEVRAMELAPVPTAAIRWREPPVLALAAVAGSALGRLHSPSTASVAAWTAAGAAIRTLHNAPLPPWRNSTLDGLAAELDAACEWIVAQQVLPAATVAANRSRIGPALGTWTPIFMHGDLQLDHVFVQDDEVTGILDWSEAGPGAALYDLATLTIGHPERLDDVVAGYGCDVDRAEIRAWWAVRSLRGIRWLVEHGFDPAPEIAVLEVGSAR